MAVDGADFYAAGHAAGRGILLSGQPLHLGGAAAGSDGALGGQQPGVQFDQGWHSFPFAQCASRKRRRACRLLFDGIQLRDAAQRFFGHGATAGGVHVEKFSTDRENIRD